MDKLKLYPTDAYSVASPQGEILRTDLDGGAGRYRADVIGATSMANVTFQLLADGFQYLWAFYRAKTGHGAEPFLIDLILDGQERQERTVRFMPGSLTLSGKTRDKFYTVTAQLEVEALPADDDMDDSIVAVVDAAGGDTLGYLNLFNIIVNLNWPHL